MKYACSGVLFLLAAGCAGGSDDEAGSSAAAGSGSVLPGNYEPPPVYTSPAPPEETYYDVCIAKIICEPSPADRSALAESGCVSWRSSVEDERAWAALAQTYLTSHPDADDPPSVTHCNGNAGTQDGYSNEKYLRDDVHPVSGEAYTCRCRGAVVCTALAPAEQCVRKYAENDTANPDYVRVDCEIGSQRPCFGLLAEEGVTTCVHDDAVGTRWGYCDTGAQ